MCIAQERNAIACQHRDIFIHKCRRVLKGNGWFNRLTSPRCRGTLWVSYEKGTCSTCSNFWKAYGYSEDDAVIAIRSYREEYRNYGALAPETALYYHQKIIKEEEDERLQARLEEEQRNDVSDSSRDDISFSSMEWEEARPQEREACPNLSPRARFQVPIQTSYSEGTKSRKFKNPADYCPGFHIRKRERGAKRTIPGPMEIDLDKPLPRPPRSDSPHPNALHDNRFPDRRLAAKMYFRRVL